MTQTWIEYGLAYDNDRDINEQFINKFDSLDSAKRRKKKVEKLGASPTLIQRTVTATSWEIGGDDE